MSSKVVNLAGKTLIVDDIKVLNQSTAISRSGNVLRNTREVLNNKKAEEAGKVVYKLNISANVVERNDRSSLYQTITIGADIQNFENPNPIIAVSDTPVICAYKSYLNQSGYSTEELKALYVAGYSFDNIFTGGDSWYRGGSIFSDRTVVVRFVSEEGDNLSVVCNVGIAYDTYLRVTVSHIIDSVYGLDDRNFDTLHPAKLYLPYKEATEKAIAIYDGVLLKDQIILSVNNTTSDAMCIGVVSEAPELDDYIDGDYFVMGENDSRTGYEQYIAGTSWAKEGNSWVELTDADKLLVCLDALVQEPSINLADISNANTVSFFRTIIGNEAIFKSIFASRVEIGNILYGGDVDLDAPVGQRVSDTGFVADSDGNFEAVNTVFRGSSIDNANITNARVSGYMVAHTNGTKVFETVASGANILNLELAGVDRPYKYTWQCLNRIVKSNPVGSYSLKNTGYLWIDGSYDYFFRVVIHEGSGKAYVSGLSVLRTLHVYETNTNSYSEVYGYEQYPFICDDIGEQARTCGYIDFSKITGLLSLTIGTTYNCQGGHVYWYPQLGSTQTTINGGVDTITYNGDSLTFVTSEGDSVTIANGSLTSGFNFSLPVNLDPIQGISTGTLIPIGSANVGSPAFPYENIYANSAIYSNSAIIGDIVYNSTHFAHTPNTNLSSNWNGHITLPNGIILNFGRYNFSGSGKGGEHVTFDMPFSTVCYGVVMTCITYNANSSGRGVYTQNISTTGYTSYSRDRSIDEDFYYFAWGY